MPSHLTQSQSLSASYLNAAVTATISYSVSVTPLFRKLMTNATMSHEAENNERFMKPEVDGFDTLTPEAQQLLMAMRSPDALTQLRRLVQGSLRSLNLQVTQGVALLAESINDRESRQHMIDHFSRQVKVDMHRTLWGSRPAELVSYGKGNLSNLSRITGESEAKISRDAAAGKRYN